MSKKNSVVDIEKTLEKIPECGCWIHIGACNKAGYGRMRFNGKKTLLHRKFYEFYRGHIPLGMSVLHKCDVPSCVNPDHLYVGTNIDNIRDRVERNRNGSASGEDHGRAKLTYKQVEEIRKDVRSQSVIAKEYNTCQTNISSIKRSETWRIFGEKPPK